MPTQRRSLVSLIQRRRSISTRATPAYVI